MTHPTHSNRAYPEAPASARVPSCAPDPGSVAQVGIVPTHWGDPPEPSHAVKVDELGTVLASETTHAGAHGTDPESSDARRHPLDCACSGCVLRRIQRNAWRIRRIVRIGLSDGLQGLHKAPVAPRAPLPGSYDQATDYALAFAAHGSRADAPSPDVQADSAREGALGALAQEGRTEASDELRAGKEAHTYGVRYHARTGSTVDRPVPHDPANGYRNVLPASRRRNARDGIPSSAPGFWTKWEARLVRAEPKAYETARQLSGRDRYVDHGPCDGSCAGCEASALATWRARSEDRAIPRVERRRASRVAHAIGKRLAARVGPDSG